MKKVLLAAVTLLAHLSIFAQTGNNNVELLTRLAFGSCNDQKVDQPLWDKIAAQKPKVWIWLGDNIYANTDDTTQLRSAWNIQLSKPGYVAFAKTTKIIGTWDDHDFGQNNIGKNYKEKIASQQMLLDFLGEPKDSPRRQQEGVYTSYTYGPWGKQVKIILLDTRYNRDDYGRKGDVLGEAQWKWLENELATSKAQINLVCTSIQFTPNRALYELWKRFPSSKKRLEELIVKTNPSGLIFLSGDVHHSEFLRGEIEGLSYPVYEFTSSGMTHYNKVYHAFNKRKTIGKIYYGKSYGIIDFDWGPQPAVSFKIMDENNNRVREQKILMSDIGVRFQ